MAWRQLPLAILLLLLCGFLYAYSTDSVQSPHQHVARASSDGETLRAVIVMTRHGDRTPVKVFPNTRSQWPEGLGQLTGLGMKQLFSLGQKFRQRYIEDYNFLSPRYVTKEIHARSTSKERTLMSAQGFMHGLYPPGVGPKGALPGDMQLVPVHAAPPGEDTLLYAYKNCPKLNELTKKVRQSAQWKAMEEKTASLRTRLSDIFGFPVALKNLHGINTIIRCEEIHGREVLPGLNDTELRRELLEANEWLFRIKFPTSEMGHLAGGNLLNEIAMIFDSHMPGSAHKQMARFTLFSAHDGTILATMAAMSATNFTLPRYSDYLTYELHELRGAHEVRIYYNDEPLYIPDCHHRCSLAEFAQLALKMRHDNWYDSCGIDRCTRQDSVRTELALEDEGNFRFKEERARIAQELLNEQLANQTQRRFEWELLAGGVVVGLSVAPLCSWLLSAVTGKGNGNAPERNNSNGNRDKKSIKNKQKAGDTTPSPAAKRRSNKNL